MPKVHPDKSISWRMPEPCENCPFSNSAAGTSLRESLRRWPEITRDLQRGGHFICHKTLRAEGWADEDSDDYHAIGPELICAGAIDWQAERGIKADLVQIMERITKMDKP